MHGLAEMIQEVFDMPRSAAKNWLPAPDEAFYVILRMYGPKAEALEGEYGAYRVPPITTV